MNDDLKNLPQPSERDPHPDGAHRFLARSISFNDPAGGVPPRRLVGTVEAARYVGRTQRGAIPDYQLTVRGKSGAALKISLVESYASFT